MAEALYAAGGAATAVLALLALAGWFWRRLGRPLAAFLRDWFGEPPRPGLPQGRPGMPERVAQIEWHVGNGSPVPLRQEVRSLGAGMRRLEHEVRDYHQAVEPRQDGGEGPS